MEAMARGVPVVATDVGGMTELVEPGINGHLVPPRNAIALAEKLEELLNHAERRQSMGRLAYEKVKAEFNLENTLSQYTRLYEKTAR
jgi:colanic acid/amylovoran biosynthesis glycosyltransferase